MAEVLSEEEVEALLDEEHVEASPLDEQGEPDPAFDLNVCSLRLNGWHKQLGLVDDRLGQIVSRRLLGVLHKQSTVKMEGIRLVRFSEYLEGLETPTGLHAYSMAPLEGTLLITMDAPLVFSFVETMFGGCGRRIPISGRGFTKTEERVMGLVLGHLVDSVVQAWPQLESQQLAPLSSEHNPRACTAMPPNDVVMVRRYSVAYPGGNGELQLVMASGLVSELFQPLQDEKPMLSNDQRSLYMQQRLLDLSATVVGRVRGVSLSLRELMGLREGDILPIGSPEVVDVAVNGVTKFAARVGEIDGRVGLSILGSPEEGAP